MPAFENNNNTELNGLRSGVVQEIISRKPDFVSQWALLIFLFVLLAVITCAWFIRYPKTIVANAVLTTDNSIKEIVSRQEGHLARLLVRNEEEVTEGQIIGWIESTASHTEVMALHKQLDSCIALLSVANPGKLPGNPQGFRHLGELQTAYQQFIYAWQQFSDYRVNGFYVKNRGALQHDMDDLEKVRSAILKQLNLQEEDIRLSEESFKMNEELKREKVISNEEFRSEKSKYLNKQVSMPQTQMSLLLNMIQQREKQQALDDLMHDFNEQVITFMQATQTLKSAVEEWEKKYFLIAPSNGKVVFSGLLQQNQFLQQGKLIAYVMPVGSHYYMEAVVSQTNAGELDTGLAVQLRFQAYPYQQFGTVKGRLKYVSTIASDTGLSLTISLDNDLRTNYNKYIQYKSGLKAEAVIMIGNERLLERLYFNLLNKVKKTPAKS